MFCFRSFFYAILLGSFPSFVFANPEKITSVMDIKDKVESLQTQKGARAEDIVVVWDCHGVITAQGSPQKDVEATLNPGVLDVLDFLHTREISQVISTAWHNPYAVQEDLIRLRVAPYFEAENIERRGLEKVVLGKGKFLEGHKIGRVTALREQEEFPSPYFRKKAFGAEWCFPRINFKHIIFVDDDNHNLGIFKNDFKDTIYYNSEEDMEKLSLCHFAKPKPESNLEFSSGFPLNFPSDDESDDEF
jgi:hypothetical protein